MGSEISVVKAWKIDVSVGEPVRACIRPLLAITAPATATPCSFSTARATVDVRAFGSEKNDRDA